MNSLTFFEKQNLDILKQKNTYLAFEKDNGQIRWKTVHLGNFQCFLRKIFGAYGNTHQNKVLKVLRNELKNIVVFDDNQKNIKAMANVAKKVLNLKDSKDAQSNGIADEIILNVSSQIHLEKFKRSLAFIELNAQAIEELKQDNVPFKIKPNGSDRLGIRIAEKETSILTRKRLGQGGFKSVRTGYNVTRQSPTARATMIVDSPRMNGIMSLFNKNMAKKELKYLQAVVGDETCIQLKSSYQYTGKQGQTKVVMVMDLANGDLSKLVYNQDLTDQQRLNISSQLINGLAALSKRRIWHRDLKPLNFLYFVHNGVYKVVVADFGLAVPNDDLLARKLAAGTRGYMAPENFQFFKLKNGNKGDVYSMGRTLSEFFAGKNMPEFLKQLIHDMQLTDMNKRPSALEVQKRFEAGLAQL